MSSLWIEKDSYLQFNPKKHHINETCSRLIYHFIPYERHYKTLNEDELLELIHTAKDRKWQALDLSNCSLSALPDELWNLPDLRLLYLGNRLPLRFSKDADTPNERANTFSILPRKIESLTNLQVLSLSRNAIKIEGDTPLHLPQLIHLDIFHCDFPQVPCPLLIPSLQEIGFNCLEESLSDDFSKLKNLRYVFLTRSQISSLPEYFGSFSDLRLLYAFKTKISDLPSSIAQLRFLSVLNLNHTPLAKTLPPEILNQSGKEIVRYIFSQKSDAPKDYFNESKMVIVGQGHVGKSSLLNRLVNHTYVENASTEGIDITSWEFKRNGRSFKLNVWDFGGQEIYHSTHQFFLTKRSLYLLVWDAFAEDEYGRIDYWLKTIQSLADDSPIIIVVNKCDKDVGRIQRLDEVDYKERYPQIKDIVYISCKDNINIGKLRNTIKNYATKLPLMKTSWLSSWMIIRNKLESLSNQKNFISYIEYLNICKEEGVDVEEAKSLIKYLHDLGIVLYYHDDPLLKNIVILSSEWGTNAVYKVLEEQEKQLKGRNGVLYHRDLEVIWKDENLYPPERYQHLLNLMKKFQLIFNVTDSTYLVAELLDNKTINLNYDFSSNATLSFRYEYDFIPAGLMTRFIVAINHHLETIDGVKQCWKKGAYLRYNSAYALVRLYDDLCNRCIEIKVGGEAPRDRQTLLTMIRTTFEEINKQFNQIKIIERIPCICSPDCKFMFEYKKLLLAESKGKHTVECHDTFEDVDIRKLLDGVESYMESNYNSTPTIIQNIFSPQNSTQSNPHISITTDSSSQAIATADITINIDMRNLINGLQGDFNDFKDEVGEQSREFNEQCQKVCNALGRLDACETKDDIAKSGAMKKIERFLLECADPTSKTGKMIAGVKYASGIIKDLGKKYNKLAKWVSLPQIPLIGE